MQSSTAARRTLTGTFRCPAGSLDSSALRYLTAFPGLRRVCAALAWSLSAPFRLRGPSHSGSASWQRGSCDLSESRLLQSGKPIVTDPIRFLSCRLLVGSVAVVVAAAEIAPAQIGGDISVQGTKATFSVVADRPLYALAHTLIREYKWPVTFEESVTLYPGDWVDVTRDFSIGGRSYSHRGGRLEFSYDLGPDGAAPEDPATVLQTALDAHHHAGLPGRYNLVETADYFHIVPTARRDETGRWEPERSALDHLVSLHGRGRTPDAVLRELRRLVSADTGIEIHGALVPLFSGYPYPSVLDHFEQVPAREVLRSLIMTSGRERLWHLLCAMRHDGSGTTHHSFFLHLMPFER